MKEKPAIRLENFPGFAAWIRNGPNAFGLPRPRLTASPTKLFFFLKPATRVLWRFLHGGKKMAETKKTDPLQGPATRVR